MNDFTFGEARAGSIQVRGAGCSDGTQETLYLLSSAKNAQRLANSIARLNAGGVAPRELSNNEQTKNSKRGGRKV
ncbi:type II toxin-antitoxin system Phd/YefM family antitoxin [Paraburkholderia domus]|nr:prevent-host-death protein [Paraburkholderia domus]MBK5053422.1 prevent-host-death protein [Burkholderia sp. R-70006]MBK5065280.1 prevent-host-death protein [Burkholderia sp. R-70199]MBK5090416.1 prevent-host-death protein [Burkholderia sp. R-69927]MBK5125219.1 prevent-host-death protein [Burkholderia sp. R-69980]MBK5169320.1 prevent-host-death protein [Burkholderia sp. R-70211]MBK5184585.1 prevent-host-death protein [Burkholderia sp. R-69749]MCI0150855.1 prevent-host-death protein [Parab